MADVSVRFEGLEDLAARAKQADQRFGVLPERLLNNALRANDGGRFGTGELRQWAADIGMADARLKSFAASVDSADKAFKSAEQSVRAFLDASDMIRKLMTTGMNASAASGGGGGALGMLGGGLGTLAIVGGLAGLEALKFIGGNALHTQQRLAGLATQGTRLGGMGLAGFTGDAFTSFGFDPTQAQQFVLGFGKASGVGSMDQLRANSMEAGRLTRMLGLTDDQGAKAFGTAARIGLNKQDMRELADLVGSSVERAGRNGLEGEMLQAVVDLGKSISSASMLTSTQSSAFTLEMARMAGGINSNMTNIPGLQGAGSTNMLARVLGGIRDETSLRIPGGGRQLADLAILNVFHGDLGKAGMFAMQGQPQTKDVMLGLIEQIQRFGGANTKDSTQQFMQMSMARQVGFGTLTPEQIEKLRVGIFGANDDVEAKKRLADFDKSAGGKSQQDLTESNTKGMAELANALDRLGRGSMVGLSSAINLTRAAIEVLDKHIMPIFNKVIGTTDALVNDPGKTIKSILKNVPLDVEGDNYDEVNRKLGMGKTGQLYDTVSASADAAMAAFNSFISAVKRSIAETQEKAIRNSTRTGALPLY